MKTFLVLIYFVCLSITFSSCGKKKDDPISKMDDTAKYQTGDNQSPGNKEGQTASEEKEDGSTGKPLTEDVPGGIRINFPAGATEVEINGTIDGFKSVTYILDAKKGQTLIGSLVPISKAGIVEGNIRFSQIISPSGEADGPFGYTIEYNLTESGDWQLIVSENQMSGDAWKGLFKMTIGIK